MAINNIRDKYRYGDDGPMIDENVLVIYDEVSNIDLDEELSIERCTNTLYRMLVMNNSLSTISSGTLVNSDYNTYVNGSRWPSLCSEVAESLRQYRLRHQSDEEEIVKTSEIFDIYVDEEYVYSAQLETWGNSLHMLSNYRDIGVGGQLLVTTHSNNPVDKEALIVLSNGAPIGYLPRSDDKDYVYNKLVEGSKISIACT